MKRTALALAQAPAQATRRPAGALDPLRRRLAAAGGSAREAVIADLLEDDLDETAAALSALDRYLAIIRAELGAARDGRRLVALSALGDPGPAIDRLDATLSALRRRMAQLGRRLPA